MTMLSVPRKQTNTQLRVSVIANEIAALLFEGEKLLSLAGAERRAFADLPAPSQAIFRHYAEEAVVSVVGHLDSRATDRAVTWVCAAHNIAQEFGVDAQQTIRDAVRDGIRQHSTELLRVFREESR